jgi:hypothetical protein
MYGSPSPAEHCYLRPPYQILVDDPFSLPQELSYLPDPTLLFTDTLTTGLLLLSKPTHPRLTLLFTGIPWARNAGHLGRLRHSNVQTPGS